jgi:hypothetical protein
MKQRTVTPRIRCPCCGRLGWLSQYQKDYNVDIIANIYYGGRANKKWYIMKALNDTARLKEAKDFLAKRCFLISQQLGYQIVHKTNLDYLLSNLHTSDMDLVVDTERSSGVERPLEVDYA